MLTYTSISTDSCTSSERLTRASWRNQKSLPHSRRKLVDRDPKTLFLQVANTEFYWGTFWWNFPTLRKFSLPISEVLAMAFDSWLKYVHHTSEEVQQVSAVADEPARHAASRETCCKHRWTLSVMNLWPN